MPKDELAFLIHLVSKSHKRPIMKRPLLKNLDFDKLMRLALRNNVLYYVAREMLLAERTNFSGDVCRLLEKTVKLCNEEVNKIKSAIAVLEYCLDDYVLIKTCKGFPRLPDDLDVYVPDFNQALNSLKPHLRMLDYSTELGEAVFGGDKVAKLHIHSKIVWAGGAAFVDDELVRTDPHNETWHDVKVAVPNNEAEFLINTAHINYEKLYIDLVDLLYLCRLASQVDWKIVWAQAAKYRWKRALERTVELFDTLHQVLYPSLSPFSDLIKHRGEKNLACSELPISLPRSHIMSSFIEKGVVTYALKRALKSMRILFTGQTYGEAKIPSELLIYQNVYSLNWA